MLLHTISIHFFNYNLTLFSLNVSCCFPFSFNYIDIHFTEFFTILQSARTQLLLNMKCWWLSVFIIIFQPIQVQSLCKWVEIYVCVQVSVHSVYVWLNVGTGIEFCGIMQISKLQFSLVHLHTYISKYTFTIHT